MANDGVSPLSLISLWARTPGWQEVESLPWARVEVVGERHLANAAVAEVGFVVGYEQRRVV